MTNKTVGFAFAGRPRRPSPHEAAVPTCATIPRQDSAFSPLTLPVFLGWAFLRWALLLCDALPGEDAGEDFVDVLQLARKIEGVLDLLARDAAGDFLVGHYQIVKI